MSEQPTPYGERPAPAPLLTRVDALERDLSRMADMQAQNTSAIAGLINSVDRMRTTFDTRLTAIESQLAALHESNKLLAELITTRLPQPPTKGE